MILSQADIWAYAHVGNNMLVTNKYRPKRQGFIAQEEQKTLNIAIPLSLF